MRPGTGKHADELTVRKLFRKTRFGFFSLFAVVVLAISALSIRTVSRELRDEYISNSESIAKNIADSSVDILLNRNLATLQSLIDQFVQIQSIRYIYITSDTGEFLAHTFVPGIPEQILASDPTATEPVDRSIAGMGDFVEVGSPILSGVAGTVHVGMDLETLGLKIRRAMGQQIALLCIILVVGVLASIWLVNLASKPLTDLLGYVAQLARARAGDESPDEAVLVRHDEVGDMARLIRFAAAPPEDSGERAGSRG